VRTTEKKAAVAAYKQRKVVAGVFAIRCLPTGEQWVGLANDLSTIKNRVWFTLGLGKSSYGTLQDAWNTHGADGFVFQELERLDDEREPYSREVALKARMDYWRAETGASAINP
jgi:hypothetical protein